MNKEYKNIWKFIKSENPALGSMAISMAKGLNNEDNTNYKNNDNIVSMIELKQKMYNFHNNIPIDDTLNPRIQMHQWYWYYVIALIQDRQANADHNLTIWESYRKEVK